MSVTFVLLCVLNLYVEGLLIIANTSMKLVVWSDANLHNSNHTAYTFPFASTLHLSNQVRNVSNVSGYVLYLGEPRSTYFVSGDFRDKLHSYQTNPHIAGVIAIDPKLDPGYLPVGLNIPSDVHLPVWVIGRGAIPKALMDLIRLNEGLPMNVTGLEVNNWEIRNPGHWFWLVVLVLGNIVACLASMVTLFFSWATGSKKMTIAIVCLVLEIVGSIIRILELILEWCLGIKTLKFFLTMSFPFLLASSGLLVFFWLDLTSGSLYSGKFLDTMKIPAIVFLLLLFSNEVILDILGYYYDIQITAVYVIYVLLCVFTGLLYFVVAYKISKIIKGNAKGKFLRKINYKAIACGAVLVGVSLVGFIIAIPGSSDTYNTFMLLWSLIFAGFIIISLLQNSIFFPSRHKITITFSSQKSQSRSKSQPSPQL